MLLIVPLLILAWEFPRAYTPAPDQFVLTYTLSGQTALQEWQSPLSAVGACGTADVDTFCTTIPGCPGVGEVLSVWAQAQWGEERSGASETLVCHLQPGCVCRVVPTGLDTEGKPVPLSETAYVPPPVPAPPAFAPQFLPAPV
jgi:hypothetical protein